jgi:hypothetical protein
MLVLARIDEPDVPDAEGKVIIDFSLYSARAIFRGKDLDAKERWFVEYPATDLFGSLHRYTGCEIGYE